MWKLFISVLAMSDTGSISVNTLTSDFPDRAQCERVAADYAKEHHGELLSHQFTMKITAECRPESTRPAMAGPPLPPPDAIVRNFFGWR